VRNTTVRRRKLTATLVSLLLSAGVLTALQAQAAQAATASAGGTNTSLTHLVYRGTTTLRGALTAGGTASSHPRQVPFLTPNQSPPSANSISSKPDTLASTNPGFFGFNGLTGAQSRSVNPFDVEPPDQGLCAGNGDVVEGVNLALAVYSTAGHLIQGPISLYKFFNEPTSVFPIGDIKCYFDTQTQRWFITQLASNLSTFSRVDIAVSKTSNPAGAYRLFAINDTNSGRALCPCLGDQPLIGADANGFYVSVNAFSLTSFTFEGVSIYATSKAGLESGMAGPVVHLMPASIQPDNPPVSLQPATSPAGVFQTAAGGTEYLMSSNDFAPGMQHRILAWALSGTSSLLTATPALSLHGVLLGSESYGRPMPVPQKAGPIPLGASAHATFPSRLSADDQRMNQVVYANGKLWAGLNTTVGTQTSIAWFVVRPAGGGSSFSAAIANQGYLTAKNAGVFYPSIGVNGSGAAIMAFDLSGPNNFPSVAYAAVSATRPAGPIHIAAAGVDPEDGFTCYSQLGFGPTCRWGDYSAAVGTPAGTIWFAGEYIPDLPRDHFVNWGTFIGSVTP
jgi:hypothetical protein